MALVLKTNELQGSGGSNPSLTATLFVRDQRRQTAPLSFFPHCSAVAPRGMPIPLRFIGYLTVVASLIPPGTALMRLRFAQDQERNMPLGRGNALD